jgi:DNA-binding PadR family transcriptional regulator
MIDGGLIREGNQRSDPKLGDERRIYYAITTAGKRALEAELQRYYEVVALVATQRLTPQGGGYAD